MKHTYNSSVIALVLTSLVLAAVEPVVLVRVGDEARAYPIQILMWL